MILCATEDVALCGASVETHVSRHCVTGHDLLRKLSPRGVFAVAGNIAVNTVSVSLERASLLRDGGTVKGQSELGHVIVVEVENPRRTLVLGIDIPVGLGCVADEHSFRILASLDPGTFGEIGLIGGPDETTSAEGGL